jgi:hypothetical protein
MSDQDLRGKLKGRLEALGPGIGRVHDYERWAVAASDFLKLFQDPVSKKIFGWEITRTGLKVTKAAMRKWKLSHRYLLRGYYALEDAAGTEKTFQSLVDTIVVDLTRTKLPGTQGEQLPEATIEIRMFGAVLCHVAEIRLPEVAEIIEELPEADETDLQLLGLEYYLTPGDDILDAQDLVSLGEEGDA